MTGVSIEHWRGSLGLFDRKNISKKYIKGRNDSDGFHITEFCRKLSHLLSVPFEIVPLVLSVGV